MLEDSGEVRLKRWLLDDQVDSVLELVTFSPVAQVIHMLLVGSGPLLRKLPPVTEDRKDETENAARSCRYQSAVEGNGEVHIIMRTYLSVRERRVHRLVVKAWQAVVFQRESK